MDSEIDIGALLCGHGGGVAELAQQEPQDRECDMVSMFSGVSDAVAQPAARPAAPLLGTPTKSSTGKRKLEDACKI